MFSTFLEEAAVERILSVALSAKDVTPKERHQLRHLIRHYMKMKHPFTVCVRDNTKRFGKERAERVCAVLKDIGKGTTKWRKGRQTLNASECPYISEPIFNILDELAQDTEFRSYLSELAS